MAFEPLIAAVRAFFAPSTAEDEIWARAARRVGGTLDVYPGSLFRPTKRMITVDVDGTSVVVDTFVEYQGRQRVECTRVQAKPLRGLCEMRLFVAPRGLLGRVTKHLGLGQTLTGDARFDDRFSVTGGPPSLLREYLAPSIVRTLLATEEGFALEDGELRIVREGTPGKSEPLVAMVRFAEAIVQRGDALVRGVVRVAEALDLPTLEPFELPASGQVTVARGVRRRHELALSVRVRLETAATIVECQVGASAAWSLERDHDGGVVSSGAPPSSTQAVFEVAPLLAGVRQHGTSVEVAFAGLEPDPSEVAGLVDAVVESLVGGPYR